MINVMSAIVGLLPPKRIDEDHGKVTRTEECLNDGNSH